MWLLFKLVCLAAFAQPPIPLGRAGWAIFFTAFSGCLVGINQKANEPVRYIYNSNDPKQIYPKYGADNECQYYKK